MDRLRSTSGQADTKESLEAPRPDMDEPPATMSDRPADGRGGSASSLGAQAQAGTTSAEPLPRVSFPRIKPSTPPTDGSFGVVSSNGQLVCEFKSEESSATPPSEEKIAGSPSSDSEPKALGGSIRFPPPQASTQIEVTPPTPSQAEEGNTLVDHDSYPEVYVPEDEAAKPRLLPRKSLPMDRGSSHTTSESLSTQVGYPEHNHMSMGSPPPNLPLVTPIHLLGDQSDTVDCPFCLRRVETMVKKKASARTHILGTVCLFTTLFGMVVPYCCNWYSNTEHHCTNCKRKLAHRRHDAKEFVPLGTNPALKEVSRFEAAERQEKK